jgi:hypothetical protein
VYLAYFQWRLLTTAGAFILPPGGGANHTLAGEQAMPSHAPLPRIRCTIVRLDRDQAIPVTVAHPGDQLAALVEVNPGQAPAVLIVEVCRGDVPRGRWVQQVQGPAQLAYRLHWQDRPAASTRLAVRIWCGEVLLASRTVLLLPGPADPQGRLPARAPQAPQSEATRLAFQQQFRDLLDETR